MRQISETTDLEVCYRLRHTVFVEEQGVSADEEYDGLDVEATHILAREGGRAVGCVRILWRDETAKIGRVCVLKEARGTGLGAALIQACLAHAQDRGASLAKLSAQITALTFYEKLGFTAYGPVFDDAGIPHRDMEKPL